MVVSDFAYNSALTIGVGVLATRASYLATKGLYITTGVHPGFVLDKFIPDTVLAKLFSTSQYLDWPIKKLRKVVVVHITPELYALTVGPVAEEVVYRLLFQNTLSGGLRGIGIEGSSNSITSISSQSLFFAFSHQADPTHLDFTNQMIKGMIFGYIQSRSLLGGFLEGSLVHSLSNLSIDLFPISNNEFAVAATVLVVGGMLIFLISNLPRGV